MTTFTRVLAYGLGALLLAGLVLLALAGVAAATALLVTAGAVVLLIAFGGLMGGRHSSGADAPAEDDRGGKMEP
jgi:NADH:ubiquinone oxidoreductase subunit 6 (subunit J)